MQAATAAPAAEKPKDDPDLVFKYNAAAHNALCTEKPWSKDPHYFKHVKISATALIKMVMHARSGGDIEVMGMLQGKIEANTFIVMDTFALPVDGTETRVNAGAEAMEYVVGYVELIKKVGRTENPIGWYHSHPGYGCWLSGIDVATQNLNQTFQEPWLAIVVDPKKTVASGKINVGAFRTYPKDYKPPEQTASEYQTIPFDKIEDFGVHANQYYQLDVSYFKSALDSHMLDLLWDKYWVSTLSSSSILQNREYTSRQLTDLADKLEQAETSLAHGGGRIGGFFVPEQKKKEESALSKITKDCVRPSTEQMHGLMAQVIKDVLFNLKPK